MVRLAVPVNLPTPNEPTRNLARQFSAINGNVGAVNVLCSRCKTRGRVNSMLLGKGKKRPPFVCGACR